MRCWPVLLAAAACGRIGFDDGEPQPIDPVDPATARLALVAGSLPNPGQKRPTFDA